MKALRQDVATPSFRNNRKQVSDSVFPAPVSSCTGQSAPKLRYFIRKQVFDSVAPAPESDLSNLFHISWCRPCSCGYSSQRRPCSPCYTFHCLATSASSHLSFRHSSGNKFPIRVFQHRRQARVALYAFLSYTFVRNLKVNTIERKVRFWQNRDISKKRDGGYFK
jgi:hypothetical protein